MGRHPIDSSPELEITVHPRRSNPHRVSPSPPRARPPRPSNPPPPQPPYQPFKKWFVWLVPLMIFANILMFIVSLYVNDCPHNSQNCVGANILGPFAFQPTKENPLLGPSAKTLLKMGALKWSYVVEKHQVWRIASCMWLHAGVVHVAANMVSLIFVGIRLEQEFGFVRIGLLYVLSGIGGSLLSVLFIRFTISVGASGALFGLLGSMLSELLTNWTIYANKLATLLTLVLIIAINLAVGILPHVDNYAHLGGFIAGFFLGFIVFVRPQYGWLNHKTAPPGYFAPAAKSKYKTYQYVMFFLSLVLLIAGFTSGLILLLNGVDGNDHCSWCHYLSCVPTPFWKCDNQCRLINQNGSQVSLTCLGNGKSKNYMLSTDNSTVEIAQLCTQLCDL